MENMDKQLQDLYNHICEKQDKLEIYLSKNAMAFRKSGELAAVEQIKEFIESKYISNSILKEIN